MWPLCFWPFCVALATFLLVRQIDGVGYNIVWGRGAILSVLLHFGLISVIVIPLGTALHFIRFDPTQAHWKSLPADAISIFLLTAWPEELLFRGLLQNSLSRTFSSETAGGFAASVVFGLAHITNNGVFPNWRYAVVGDRQNDEIRSRAEDSALATPSAKKNRNGVGGQRFPCAACGWIRRMALANYDADVEK